MPPKTGALVSWPAAAAWILPMIGSLVAFLQEGANPIFLVLPEWLACVAALHRFQFHPAEILRLHSNRQATD